MLCEQPFALKQLIPNFPESNPMIPQTNNAVITGASAISRFVCSSSKARQFKSGLTALLSIAALMLSVASANAADVASISQLGVDIDGEAAGDYFGSSVSMSADGTVVAIGARGNDDNGTNSGHVRVYKWTGSWQQLGSDIDGEAAGDSSGYSVSISADGTVVAIGAPDNDGKGRNFGHVRVYSWTGSIWQQLGDDIDGESLDSTSGHSVSMSADGTTVAIGGPYNKNVNGFDSGHVRIYQWTDGSWQQLGSDIDGEACV